MKNNLRPLTAAMIETLMEIHEREIMGKSLCDQRTKHVKGLFERKLIDIKKCVNEQGKSYMGFYTTEYGKDYMSKKIIDAGNTPSD